MAVCACGQTLSATQQAERVRRWAELDDAKMEAACKGLWPAVLENVRQVRFARQGLAIQRVRCLLSMVSVDPSEHFMC